MIVLNNREVFLIKDQKIQLHKGIYKFTWPYLGAWLSADENNEVKVFYCNVELRVGQDDDLKEGKLLVATVTAQKNTPGVQNFIEEIATKVRLTFFGQIFHENHWNESKLPDDAIQWIEIHNFESDNEINEVKLKWNSEKKAYHSPSWKKLQ